MSSPRAIVAVLRVLHDRLAAHVARLAADGLRRHAYPSDWTVADVLSHLGSGAELTLQRLDDAPDEASMEAMTAVWDSWNARSPEEQAAALLAVDGELVDRLERTDEGSLECLRRELAGMDLGPGQMLALRVAEVAMHSWDVFVVVDPAAVVAPEAVPVLLDVLPVTLRFAAKPGDDQLSLLVRLTSPASDQVLTIAGGETRLTPQAERPDQAVDGELTMPAEAFLRLVYGRLDPDHQPPVEQTGAADLARLRKLFPGF